MTTLKTSCPICFSEQFEIFSSDKDRSYCLCQNCSLIFVPRSELINEESEKKRYDFHEADTGYESYLTKIAEQVAAELSRSSTGLDFGCGKTKILATKLNELNHQVESYDYYFHRDESLLNQKYDFLILSEVIEHLREPREMMEKLSGLLNEKGKIFIKTKFYPEKKSVFDSWFYKRDITHIQFFSNRSMEKLQEILSLKNVKALGDDLYLLSN